MPIYIICIYAYRMVLSRARVVSADTAAKMTPGRLLKEGMKGGKEEGRNEEREGGREGGKEKGWEKGRAKGRKEGKY